VTATQRPPARRRPQRYDPVPAHMRKWRAVFTIQGVVMAAGGLALAAFQLGQGKSLIWPAVMVVLGIGLAVIAQRPFLYRWAERPPKIRDSESKAPVLKHAKQAPAPAKKKAGPELPLPADELGPELRYLVRYVRHLVDNNMGGHLEELTAMWEQHDWDPDLDDDDDGYSEYRRAVETALWLAAQHQEYSEDVDIARIAAGAGDPSNPFTFICEMDAITPVAGAMAVLAVARLVPNYDEFSDGLINQILAPWRQLLLPYRLGDSVFEYDTATGGYARRLVAPPRPRPPAATLDEVLAGKSSPVQRPSTVPPAPAAPPRAEPARPAPARPEPARPTATAQPVPAQPAPAAGRIAPAEDVELVVQAAELVIYSQFGSTAMIQRKLRLGFADASAVVDVLVRLRVLDEQDTPSGREVLGDPEDWPMTEQFIRRKFAAGRV
jgi:Ftsk gamma domain